MRKPAWFDWSVVLIGAVVVASAGCGSESGTDLFAGVSGSGGAAHDASMGGQAGAEGGTGGGGAGGSLGGSAGKAGAQGGAGGSVVEDAGEGPEAAAGAGGGPIDCAAECAKDCQQPGSTSKACQDCATALCAQDYIAMQQAPEIAQYDSCTKQCGANASCWNQCCQQHQQACVAFSVFTGCTCGYKSTDCKSACAELCSGGSFGQPCVDCAIASPCGRELYPFMFADGNDQYYPCVQGCSDDPCRQECCNDWPEACASRKATVACVCGP
ncbi:MAG: hypothetical protein HY898_08985 [Deltaproteobacteria bacterium]|nr:hypothetical protein [Deltaproteobacteria bacterium]